MKKILTKEQQAKKNQRNQLLIGIIMVGLMIFGTAGYAFSSKEGTSTGPSTTILYNGINFVRSGDYWRFNSGGNEFITKYNANETKELNVNMNRLIKDYQSKPLYFVTESGEPNNEIEANMGSFVLRIRGACLPNQECNGNLPVKNCSIDNIIIIKEPVNQTDENIYQNENCIFITAYYSNQTKFADAFLFNILKI